MGKTILSVIILILGLYYILNFNPHDKEAFESKDTDPNRDHAPSKKINPHKRSKFDRRDSGKKEKYQCPNVLIQKGNTFYLHNNKVAKVPGVNPLKFSSLEEYTEFLQWQKSQGIHCPVLYVRESYDAQGNRVYKSRPSVTSQQGGLPNLILPLPTQKKTKLIDSGRSDPPYNKNSYPAYDKDNQYVGIHTPLDKLYSSKNQISPNPMDDNWGGHQYTKSMLDSGYFKDDEVWEWH